MRVGSIELARCPVDVGDTQMSAGRLRQEDNGLKRMEERALQVALVSQEHTKILVRGGELVVADQGVLVRRDRVVDPPEFDQHVAQVRVRIRVAGGDLDRAVDQAEGFVMACELEEEDTEEIQDRGRVGVSIEDLHIGIARGGEVAGAVGGDGGLDLLGSDFTQGYGLAKELL